MTINYLKENSLIDVKKYLSFRDIHGDGSYVYQIRHHDDDPNTPATLEKNVIVNHYCVVKLKDKIDFGDKDYVNLSEKDVEVLKNKLQ